MNLLPRDVTKSVAVSVEANRGIEACFAAGPTYADVATVALTGVVEVFVGRSNTAEYLAFPVPSTFPGPYICSCHSEALFCGDAPASKVKEDVGGCVFKVQPGPVWLGFGGTVVLRGWKSRIGYAMYVPEALAVVDARSCELPNRAAVAMRIYCSELS